MAVATATALTLAAAAAATAIKTASDEAKAKKQRKVQAATTRYSPWTGMQGKEPMQVDAFGNALSAAGAAMAMNQQMGGDMTAKSANPAAELGGAIQTGAGSAVDAQGLPSVDNSSFGGSYNQFAKPPTNVAGSSWNMRNKYRG